MDTLTIEFDDRPETVTLRQSPVSLSEYFAVREAIDRNTPRASSVAFLLRRRKSPAPPSAVDLSRHPEAQAVTVRPHDLETYDELANGKANEK